MYGFSNGKTIMMIHDYSKTKTDVHGENYLLCLEITALFEISAYVGELKISKRFQDLIKRQIGDEYIHVEYNLHDRIKTDNSDKDTDLKPFLKKLEFELETITNDEYNEKTSIEEGQETTKYCRLAVIIDVTSILRVHVEIITLD